MDHLKSILSKLVKKEEVLERANQKRELHPKHLRPQRRDGERKETAIFYPQIPSEFELQAELFLRLRAEGYNARGEVHGRCLDRGRWCRARFDIVIFSELNFPRIIVECKNNFSTGDSISEATRQFRKYSQFGCLIIKYSGRDIDRTMKIIEDEMLRIETI